MYGIFQNVGPEIPFTLILLALLGLRANVAPRTSLWIKTSPEKLWPIIDIFDGKVENWGRTIVSTSLVDEQQQIYRKTFLTSLPSGLQKSATALFRLSKRAENQTIELHREGLGDQPRTNELLRISHELSPENGGTRLRTVYNWGSRPLIAQIIARADLWSGAYRIKGLAETGIPNERPYALISAAVALVTGLLTLVTFGLVVGIKFALLVVFALFVHELGHLIAYRIVGQPWGRMVFLPFLGAIAMPRAGFESQGQAVFSALMGPGLSLLLVFLCALHAFLGQPLVPILCVLGIITAGLNLFNLLPAEPLDGGIALRSVLGRLIGANAHYGLMAIGACVVAIGFKFDQFILVIFGGMAMLANLKPRKIDVGLKPLSTLQVGISALCYMALTSAHVILLFYFIDQVRHLRT